MTTLRSRIQGLRRPVAGESKSFVPHQELHDLLTEEEIKIILQSRDVTKWYNLEEVVEKVFSSAQRIFAILVVLNGQEKEILRFIESDNFQATPLDHKLPFTMHNLQNIIPDIAIEFYEKQWEFSAPVLTRGVDHRILDIHTALPFEENRKGRSLIRKQFPETIDGSDVNHEQELKNLSLLNQLKHPNILELLASYTYQGRRNFIFPIADGGDLEAFFKLECRSTPFKADYTFYYALANLSNAIEKMHDFTTEKNLELRLIGLHKDIKPSNILVDGDSFVLADFGLSNFKSESEYSHTPFRIGGGDFLAPECEDYDDGMKKGLVNRSSDIWSFGCVLAEVLTYMVYGKTGIVEFRNGRAIKVNSIWKVRTFYTNGGQVNGYVLLWLSKLEERCTPSEMRLVELIRAILVVKREDRPPARAITKCLRLIAIRELLDSVSTLYESTIESKVDTTRWLHAYIEYLKFHSWKSTYESITAKSFDKSESDLDLDKIIQCLKAFHSELSLISVRYEVAKSPIFTELQNLNERLLELFPKDLREITQSFLELKLLNKKNYPSGDLSQIPSFLASLGSNIRFLAFIKNMLAAADKKSTELELERSKKGKHALYIEEEKVRIDGDLGDHHLGWKWDDTTDTTRRVLIEFIVYDTHWSGAIMEEMITRVVNIANFLNEITTDMKAFGLLHCSGYLHSVRRHSFGLIFDFPSSNADDTPKTLNTLILESRGKIDAPFLGPRFALACNLCSILINLHKATLFHKNVSSQNVIFFSSDLETLSSPYLIGFNHSRPSDPTAFSEGPQSSRTTRKYQDPRYVQSKRFRLEYDYYSIGLVLLEIGLWDTIENMGKKARSLEELQDILITKRAPALGHFVGKSYRDAVLACLTGKFSGSEEESSTDTRILQFERQVLMPLSQLAA